MNHSVHDDLSSRSRRRYIRRNVECSMLHHNTMVSSRSTTPIRYEGTLLDLLEKQQDHVSQSSDSIASGSSQPSEQDFEGSHARDDGHDDDDSESYFSDYSNEEIDIIQKQLDDYIQKSIDEEFQKQLEQEIDKEQRRILETQWEEEMDQCLKSELGRLSLYDSEWESYDPPMHNDETIPTDALFERESPAPKGFRSHFFAMTPDQDTATGFASENQSRETTVQDIGNLIQNVIDRYSGMI